MTGQGTEAPAEVGRHAGLEGRPRPVWPSRVKEAVPLRDEGRGREQMTLGWHDGQYYKDEVTDEHRDRQVAALSRVRDGIVAG